MKGLNADDNVNRMLWALLALALVGCAASVLLLTALGVTSWNEIVESLRDTAVKFIAMAERGELVDLFFEWAFGLIGLVFFLVPALLAMLFVNAFVKLEPGPECDVPAEQESNE